MPKSNADAAEAWFEENDPEGVAFEYDVLDVKEAANLRAGETYLDQAPD